MSREDVEPPSGARPTFLLSSERSGSNLLRSILNTHTEVTAPHPLETGFPIQNSVSPASLDPADRRRFVRDLIVNKRYSFHPLTTPLNPGSVAERVDRDEVPSFFSVQRALYEEACDAEDSTLWSTKYPGLWERLDGAFEYYDDLRIVYLVRDSRDVVLSFKNSNIKLYHPYYSANRWQDEQARGLELLDERPERVHVIRYQDLLQDPEQEVHGVCDFLDVPFEESMLYYYETEDAQATSERSEVFENLQVPIKSDNYDKFREQLPDEEVKLTEWVTREEMEAFGFEPTYSDAELEGFEPEDERTYSNRDSELERSATLSQWRATPVEQMKRHASRFHRIYIHLRYGN